MARLPQNIRELRNRYGFTTSNVLTYSNPKTDKTYKTTGIPTAVLHLTPMMFGVCPAAGSCKTVCLHNAGNPAYFSVKMSARKRRSQAFKAQPTAFKQLLLIELARFAGRHPEAPTLAVRLNGTSDIAWESEFVTVDLLLSGYLYRAFGVSIASGDYRFLALLKAIDSRFQPYDYTKRVDRDIDLCRQLGYHITMSHGSIHDTLAFAREHGLNYAAPMLVTRGHALPSEVCVDGAWFPVLDGDHNDARFQDRADRTRVIGLRYKRAQGATDAQVRAFCLPADSRYDIVLG